MTSTPLPLNFLKLLAHDVRWQLLSLLAKSDHRVQEIVAAVQKPQNLVSYHLRLLREGNIVHERRSSADGRDVYYSLDVAYLSGMYLESGQALHPALACDPPAAQAEASLEAVEEKRPFRVLFLCTHNSARSQLAEGILRAKCGNAVDVVSAGSQPSHVHPLAIKAAQKMNIDISQQRSKNMDEFAGQTFDYVITVCDQVREICPVFSEETEQSHWSFPDPAAVTGTEDEKFKAFLQTARELSTRIGFLCLAIEKQLKKRNQLTN